MTIEEIKSIEMFNKEVNTYKNIIIDIHAEWCGPCKKLAKPLEELAEKYENTIKFYKLDIDDMEELGLPIEIPETIPTILYFKEGKEIERLSTSDIKTIENNFILF